MNYGRVVFYMLLLAFSKESICLAVTPLSIETTETDGVPVEQAEAAENSAQGLVESRQLLSDLVETGFPGDGYKLHHNDDGSLEEIAYLDGTTVRFSYLSSVDGEILGFEISLNGERLVYVSDRGILETDGQHEQNPAYVVRMASSSESFKKILACFKKPQESVTDKGTQETEAMVDFKALKKALTELKHERDKAIQMSEQASAVRTSSAEIKTAVETVPEAPQEFSDERLRSALQRARARFYSRLEAIIPGQTIIQSLGDVTEILIILPRAD